MLPSPPQRGEGNISNPRVLSDMGLAILTCSYGFESYLKSQNKRNIKQILCYAQRYHTILETGDARSVVQEEKEKMEPE